MRHGAHRDDEERDRAAIAAIMGRSMGGDWPDQAMPPGTRVRVIKDVAWDGPWRHVFTGTIDATIVPYPVENARAHPGELQYSVRFDGPQMDVTDLGPYRKAVIWARYLEPL